MDSSVWPSAALDHAIGLLGGQARVTDPRIAQAAWVARCVGRGETAPLTPRDVSALADTLTVRTLGDGARLFSSDRSPSGVWIVRSGQVELSTGAGRGRIVVGLIHAGDVDGDIALLLDRAHPYTARASGEATCLHLSRKDFEELLATRPAIARRWLSSVAQRLAGTQNRVMGLLGKSLREQVVQLLRDEAVDDTVRLPQRTLAAMLGVARPSLNRTLKSLEREGDISLGYSAIELHHVDRRT